MHQVERSTQFRTTLLLVVIMFTGALTAQEVQTQAEPSRVEANAGASAPQRVDVPLCRMLDTAVEAPGANQQSSRVVKFSGSRCSNLVSPSATALVVRLTSLDRNALGSDTGAPEERLAQTLPMTANGELNFVVPSGRSLAVDLEAYILPPGVWVTTNSTSESAPSVSATKGAAPPNLRVGTDANYTGTAARLVLDGDLAGYPSAGAVLDTFSTTAKTDSAGASVIARIGTSNLNSGFAVHASNDSRLMIMKGHGMLELPPTGYLNGRSDYYGSSGSKIQGDIVHDVTLTGPLDADGLADSRLYFFKAHSSEAGSPAITKFHAQTSGFYNQENINFDSQLHYHNSNQYHFRAASTVELDPVTSKPKPTFWVKAANDYNSKIGTRADMYVSGIAGIGTTGTTQNVLSVARDQNQVTAVRIANAGSADSAATNTSVAVGVRLAEGTTDKAAIMSVGSLNTAAVGGANTLQVWNYANGAMLFATANAERVRIGADGNVGIGTNAPTVKLDVNGAARVATTLTVAGAVSSGNLTVTGNVDSSGNLTVAGNIVTTGDITGARVFNAVFQDVAEWVPATADLAPGTVVVLNTAKNNEVMASHAAYDTSVAGVVSEQPGLLLGVGAANKEMVATTGRVKVRVDARRSPVRVGDLLVTSEVAGTAMRSEPMDVNGRKFHQPGTIIGKALEPLEGGLGEILVLLSMQ